MSKTKKTKVAYVLSYRDPNYVRSNFILRMLEAESSIELFKAINTSKSVSRYFQTLSKLIKLRFTENPDVYILGFRGHEVFWPVRLLTIGKPLIFDEFLNAYDWSVKEHKKKLSVITSKFIYLNLYLMLRSCAVVLADTELHARRSIELFHLKPDKFYVIYVGTNEGLFKEVSKKSEGNKLNLLFYGTFLPLHGIHVILAAAQKLKDQPVRFKIVGGANKPEKLREFKQQLTDMNLDNVEHHDWIEYEKLPDEIAKADLCLGGPFGNTPQGLKVISGKVYQFLFMSKPTIIGEIDEEVGFVDKDNCLLVPQGSAEDLANVIKWANNNKQKLDKIGKNGKKLYDTKFSVAAQKDNFVELIQKVSV